MLAGGGVSLLDRLVLSAKTRAIPIPVMTVGRQSVSARRAAEAGTLQVLKKPREPERLLEAVRDAIGGPIVS